MSELLVLGARGEDARRWSEALSLFPRSDVYFTPGYARAYEDLGWGRATGFLFLSEAGAVLHPLIVREIADLPWAAGTPEAQGARDLVSPYGYGGPLCSLPGMEPGAASEGPERETLIAEFDREFRAACRQMGIVSEFVRFHPLLGTHEGLAGRIGLTRRGETVWLELPDGAAEGEAEGDSPADRLMARMQPSARNKVRRARRCGVTVEFSRAAVAIATLHRLYDETVGRLDAPAEYRFPPSYFEAMASLPGSEILVSRAEGRAVWAGIFLAHGPFLHYHLSGSAAGEKVPGANNLALLEAGLRAAAAGARVFHLGGGFGARSDSLLAFKASMGDRRAEYWTGERIHDADRYARLCKAWGRAQAAASGDEAGGASACVSGGTAGDGYFPAYRAPVLMEMARGR